MNKFFLPVLLIAALVLVSGCAQSTQKSTPSPKPTQTPEPTQTATATPTETISPTSTQTAEANPITSAKTIEITSAGFEPKSIIVKAGESVTFTNKDTSQHWPASAMHPTHKVYPGSDIAKCGTSEQSNIFDVCRGLAQGESWPFTFAEKGTWKYHDHLNSGSTGTIVVE